MTAYYNEIDDFAADWLENLIAANLIAPGDVDRRSIEEVQADDIRGYTQCHFFAGIGVWSYGLRRAGWSDDRPIWTGSCPCPPFSSAGKQKACPECGGFGPVPHVARTGVFVCCHCEHEWYADGRHLWPEFARLIWERRPGVVLGEQVASADGRIWVDLVCSSLEIMGYAAGAVDTSSAVHGAPHIRQRLRFAAYHHGSAAGGVGYTTGAGSLSGTFGGLHLGEEGAGSWDGESERSGDAGGVVNSKLPEESRHGRDSGEGVCVEEAARPTGGRLADAVGRDVYGAGMLRGEHGQRSEDASAGGGDQRPCPTNGFWRDADWLLCRDGKWRPVKPGTFPLVNGAAARVGRLRAYGNAVDAEATKGFVQAVMESL